MKTLENGWYIGINAISSHFWDLGRFFVLSYIACPRYPYI